MRIKRKRRLSTERLEERNLLAALTQVGYFDTWDGGIIPSTDAAGIAFHAPSENLYIVDSEINETPEYMGVNVFEASSEGQTLIRSIDSQNEEPLYKTPIVYTEIGIPPTS